MKHTPNMPLGRRIGTAMPRSEKRGVMPALEKENRPNGRIKPKFRTEREEAQRKTLDKRFANRKRPPIDYYDIGVPYFEETDGPMDE